ncbi:nucleotide exchange factor GrpE [Hyphobacterium marinum]|uniref:Protein GrpE n=1 Tax=Hyphobacterium marinum TaxID=3116574 RepID=A0ABU7LWN3_9PROT|nr:nucleotide exchange factor GrpE [Hyphobacterium sp. Y6023]MEE2565410.1 nucleotide exchange factor GrpE [Hyphobacterium sp. Y6023]
MSDKTTKPATPEVDDEDIESIVAAAEKAEAEALAEAEKAEADADSESGSEIDRLEAELEKAREDMMRALADAQNTRRRAEREVKETRDYAVSKFASDLLGVADNLARALDAVNRDEMGEAGKQLADGVELTQRALLTAFERHGVKKVDPAPGDAFDPNRHQATAQFPSEHASGTIAVVMAPGYVIGERTLRAAMVAVSTGPAEAEGGGSDGSVDVKA